jgi:hypothetical protein
VTSTGHFSSTRPRRFAAGSEPRLAHGGCGEHEQPAAESQRRDHEQANRGAGGGHDERDDHRAGDPDELLGDRVERVHLGEQPARGDDRIDAAGDRQDRRGEQSERERRRQQARERVRAVCEHGGEQRVARERDAEHAAGAETDESAAEQRAGDGGAHGERGDGEAGGGVAAQHALDVHEQGDAQHPLGHAGHELRAHQAHEPAHVQHVGQCGHGHLLVTRAGRGSGAWGCGTAAGVLA